VFGSTGFYLQNQSNLLHETHLYKKILLFFF